MGKHTLRGVPLRVWVSEEEHRLIKDKSEAAGIRMSEFVRRQCVDGVVVIQDTKNIKGIMNEISLIGSNLNQIAKHSNTLGALSSDDFEEVKVQYEHLLATVLDKLLGVR